MPPISIFQQFLRGGNSRDSQFPFGATSRAVGVGGIALSPALRCVILALLLLGLFANPANAWPGSEGKNGHPGKRPKVGLILSGGGAMGLAHIGVLRVLDSAGIVPDYVVGTSMGAIIGALYSSGYTPDQIKKLNEDANWGELLSNNISLRNVTIDRKGEVGRSNITFYWRKGTFRLPMGLIESQSLWNFFYRLTWPVADRPHFDQLPIPFRCCAVDMGNAQLKVFDRGSLTLAMRASMAVPGIFAPVTLGDSVIYVDGGVADNFPYETLKAMGADIVIGVYTGPHSLLEKEGISAQSIVVQSAMFYGFKKAMEDMPRCDYLIVPNLSAYTSIDFPYGKQIMQQGYLEALPYYEQLKHLADSVYGLSRGGALPPKPTPVDTTAGHIVRHVVVEGLDDETSEFVRKRMGINTPTVLEARDIDRVVQQLGNTLYFQRINHYLAPNGTLYMQPKLMDRVSLQVGLHLNEVWGPSLISRVTVLTSIRGFSRLNVDVEAAMQPRVSVWHTTYFSHNMRGLFSLGANYSLSRVPFYQGLVKLTSLWQHEADAEMKFGVILANNLLLEGGLGYHMGSSKPSAAFVQWMNIRQPRRLVLSECNVFVGISSNSYDRHFYPNRGHSLYARAYYNFYTDFFYLGDATRSPMPWVLLNTFGKSSQSFNVSVKFSYYFPLAQWCTLGVHSSLGLSNQRWGRMNGFRIGGQLFTQRNVHLDAAVYGLGQRQIAAFNFFHLDVAPRFRLWRELYLTARVNYLLANDNLVNLFKDAQYLKSNIISGALSLGYMSRFGLMEVSGGASSYDMKPYFYLTMGFPF